MDPTPPAPAWKAGGIPQSIREAPSVKRPRPGKKSLVPSARFNPPKDLAVHLARAHPILNTSIALPRSNVEHCLRVNYGKLFPYADKAIIELATKSFPSAGFMDFRPFKGYFDIGFPTNDLAAEAAKTPLVYKNTPIPTTRTRLPNDNTLVVKFSNLPSFLDPKVLHQELVNGLQQYGTNVVVDFITPQGARHLAAPRAIATLSPSNTSIALTMPPRAFIPSAPNTWFWARVESGRLVCSLCLNIDHTSDNCSYYTQEDVIKPLPSTSSTAAPDTGIGGTPLPAPWGSFLPPQPIPTQKRKPRQSKKGKAQSTNAPMQGVGSQDNMASSPNLIRYAGTHTNHALQSDTNSNQCNPQNSTHSTSIGSNASNGISPTVHYGPPPPPLASFAENPKSSIPKSAYSAVFGNAWELLSEVDESLQLKTDEDQQAVPIESFFDPVALKSLSYCFVAPPNTHFVSSHQISELLVDGKAPPKALELVKIHAATLSEGVHCPAFPEKFPTQQVAPLREKHAKADMAVRLVASTYSPSHPNHKNLVQARLDAEHQLTDYMSFLYQNDLYGTPCDPIQYEWPHAADFPTPFLSTLERMRYEDNNVNPYHQPDYDYHPEMGD